MSEGSERWSSVEDLYTVNGDPQLKSGEIVVEILIPKIPENTGTIYIADKRSTRDFAVANIATVATLDSDKQRCKHVKVVLGGIAPKPIVFEKVFDGIDMNKIIREVTAGLIKDVSVRGPATNFKVEEARVLIKNAFEEIKSGGDKSNA